jgi:tetratricopeptide (TPR) repeat protein
MRLLESRARKWRGEYELAEEAARTALRGLRGPARFAAAADLIAAMGQLSRFSEVAAFVEQVRSWPTPAASGNEQLTCLIMAAGYLIPGGYTSAAEKLIAAVEGEATTPSLRGHVYRVKGLLDATTGKLETAISHYRAARREFESVGDARCAMEARANESSCLLNLGQFEEAVHTIGRFWDEAQRLNLGFVTVGSLIHLSEIECRRGDRARALELANRALPETSRQGDKRWQGYVKRVLSALAFDAGDLPLAVAEARESLALLADVSPMLPQALARLARAQLAQRQLSSALENAEHAYSLLQAAGCLEDEEGLVRLVYAECLAEIGNRSAAVEVISRAVSWLLDRAAAIANPEWRSSFLTRISENAAILERAREWGIDVPNRPRAPQTLRGTHA